MTSDEVDTTTTTTTVQATAVNNYAIVRQSLESVPAGEDREGNGS